jgi:hypothetical protein
MSVIPAEAGIHRTLAFQLSMDSRLRGNDNLSVI